MTRNWRAWRLGQKTAKPYNMTCRKICYNMKSVQDMKILKLLQQHHWFTEIGKCKNCKNEKISLLLLWSLCTITNTGVGGGDKKIKTVENYINYPVIHSIRLRIFFRSQNKTKQRQKQFWIIFEGWFRDTQNPGMVSHAKPYLYAQFSLSLGQWIHHLNWWGKWGLFQE